MANLRAGIVPSSKAGRGKATTRLASETIETWANTWTRRVEVTLGKNGRLSITVKDGDRLLVDVELPDKTGGSAGAFSPGVTVADDSFIVVVADEEG